MASYTWRGGNGAFDTASNWSPAVMPSTGDTVYFNAAVGTVTGSGSVDTISFSSAGWVIAGDFTANTVNLINGSVTNYGSSSQLLINAALGVVGGAALTIAGSSVVSVSAGASAAFGGGALTISSRGIGDFNGALRLGAGGTTTAIIDAGVLTVGGVFSLGATAGGVGNLTVQDGAQAVVNAARDDTTNYLQVGAVAGSSSVVRVDGSGSLLLLSQDSTGIGVGGSGELDVTGGGSARFNSGNNARNPALVLGVQPGSSGSVVVSGGGSTLASGGSVIIGSAGTGAMAVVAGGVVTSVGLTSTQSALSVGAVAYSSGSLSIQGAGSQFIASGVAVIGGDNRGNGTGAGGAGTVSISMGGFLQTNSMTVEAGSSVSIDAASQDSIVGSLGLFGSFFNAGTLSISGVLNGPGTLTMGGGLTGIGTLSQANLAFSSASATLRVSALSGTSVVSGFQTGDRIDIAGNATVVGNSIVTSTGTLVLAGTDASTVIADGSGGTVVTPGITADTTVGVFRFFDSSYGTHFFTSSVSEESNIMSTRPDLVFEGVGLQSIDPSSADPNASPVYRFFDSSYGTHFFTASAAERDQVIANRSDLVYEGTGFLEHATQQPGDVGVYRFFDTRYGTHFYTADQNEYNSIKATRPDLVDEGIGFYAPSS